MDHRLYAARGGVFNQACSSGGRFRLPELHFLLDCGTARHHTCIILFAFFSIHFITAGW